MAYTGQPVPSTVNPITRAKVSDGKGIQVTVPASTTVEAQTFVLLDGFFGMAMDSVETGEAETANIGLNIEQAEYETDNIVTTDAFNKGDLVYWDGEKFTTAADDGGDPATAYRLVGKVTNGKDANNVINFILLPQQA